MRLAYAVIRDVPPRVYAAENLDVLHHLIALEVVAATPAASFPGDAVGEIRAALLEERWADAVASWIGLSGVEVDVYDGLKVFTDADIDRDFTSVQLQFAPLFRTPE